MAKVPLIGGWVGPRTRTPPMQVGGVGGQVVYGGYLDQKERDARLTGEKRYKTFSDLLANVSIVAASVRWYLNLVAKVNWKVEPPEEGSPRAHEIAELVESMLYDMATPWPRIVRRTAGYKLYGFSIQEWTAKRRKDGVIGMADVEARPQSTIERWDVDTSGTVLGVGQRSPQTGEEFYLHRGKLVYVVDDALNDSPEGLGLLRHCAEPGLRLMQFQLLEAYGYETDLRGIPLARAPLAALEARVKANRLTVEQRDAILNPLKEFISKHARRPDLGMLLDSQVFTTADEAQAPSGTRQFDVETVRGDGAMSSEAVAKALERLNRELARVLGTEHLLLGADSQGSYALAKSKTDQFALLCDSALTEIAQSMESDLLRPIFLLNGWPEEDMPTLKTDPLRTRDIEQVTGALTELAQAGAPIMTSDPAVGEVYDMLGLTRPPVELVTDLAERGGAPTEKEPTEEDELPPTQSEEAEEETA